MLGALPGLWLRNFGSSENITRPESENQKIGFSEFVLLFENSCLPDGQIEDGSLISSMELGDVTVM